MTIIILIFIVFILLVLIPFIPGFRELTRPRDSEPLYIKMDYTKDPRYFAKTFKNILKEGVKDLREGIKKIKLSKDEEVKVAASENISPNDEVFPILYVLGNMTSGEYVKFDKEIYVVGDALIGKENKVRGIVSDRNIRLSEGVRVMRWVDTEGNLEVDKGCDLGISASSVNELKIGRDCRFKRLMGKPVITSGLQREKAVPVGIAKITTAEKIDTDKRRVVIPPATKVEGTLILKKGLKVQEDCILMGSLKAYGDIVIGKRVKVFGSIFSEEDIQIGEDSEVTGNIFSQKHIEIKDGAKIGHAGIVKSVIGKKGIILGQNVTVFGYIMTEGLGVTK